MAITRRVRLEIAWDADEPYREVGTIRLTDEEMRGIKNSQILLRVVEAMDGTRETTG